MLQLSPHPSSLSCTTIYKHFIPTPFRFDFQTHSPFFSSSFVSTLENIKISQFVVIFWISRTLLIELNLWTGGKRQAAYGNICKSVENCQGRRERASECLRIYSETFSWLSEILEKIFLDDSRFRWFFHSLFVYPTMKVSSHSAVWSLWKVVK